MIDPWLKFINRCHEIPDFLFTLVISAEGITIAWEHHESEARLHSTSYGRIQIGFQHDLLCEPVLSEVFDFDHSFAPA